MTFGLRRTPHALVFAVVVLLTALLAPSALASHRAAGTTHKTSGSPAVVPGAMIAGRVPVIGAPDLGSGNLVYHGSGRNFNVPMVTAADIVIAEVDEVVDTGELDPEQIVTPGIYVDRVVVGERHRIRWFP